MKSKIAYLICFLAFAIGCTKKIENKDLLGEWKYTRVEGITKPEESSTAEELAQSKPSIKFSENGDLVIMWDRKQLSKGKFAVEGSIIRYIEELEGGAKRPIPFLIKELEGGTLVFETMSQEITRITAVKK